MNQRHGPWTVRDLQELLRDFEAEPREAGLEETTIRTYVDRSAHFVRRLDGEYQPGGPHR